MENKYPQERTASKITGETRSVEKILPKTIVTKKTAPATRTDVLYFSTLPDCAQRV